MKRSELLDRCPQLTPRKLDYWCQQGVIPGMRADERPRRRRDFTEEDLRVAHIVARVAAAFDVWSGGRGAFVGLYREIADQARAGATTVHVFLGDGVEITVALSDDERSQSVQLQSEPEPTPEPEPEPEPVGFVPGVGVDQ
jgi:hypothetical protein